MSRWDRPIAGSQGSAATIAGAAALLPLLTVAISYGVSVLQGSVPACAPPLEGCTSISAAGRHGAAWILFKVGMLPAAALLAAFWWQADRFLSEHGEHSRALARTMLIAGLTGAAFLVLYTIFLGSKGDIYNLMRRFGVTFYFGGTYLAQLLMVARLRRLEAAGRPAISTRLTRAAFVLVTALLLLGLGSIPVSNFVADKDGIENAIEWNFCLLLLCFYAIIGLAWRRYPSRASDTR